MVTIYAKTRYCIDGKEFPSLDKAQEYCEEKLAQMVDETLLKGCILSPKDRLQLFRNIHQLSYEERFAFAQWFIVNNEEIEA